MKPLCSVASAAALIVAAIIPATASAVVPPVDAVGRPAVIRCGATPAGAPVYASHADKIIFVLSGGLAAQNPAEQGALNAIRRDTELDIKVLDNPRTVADLKGKVLTFLGAVDNAASRAGVKITSVEYAMVCPTTFAP
jgi:hypothetical protein